MKMSGRKIDRYKVDLTSTMARKSVYSVQSLELNNNIIFAILDLIVLRVERYGERNVFYFLHYE